MLRVLHITYLLMGRTPFNPFSGGFIITMSVLPALHGPELQDGYEWWIWKYAEMNAGHFRILFNHFVVMTGQPQKQLG